MSALKKLKTKKISMLPCSDPNFQQKFKITNEKHRRRETYAIDRVSASCYDCIDELQFSKLSLKTNKKSGKQTFVSEDPKCPNMRTVLPNGPKYAFKQTLVYGDGGAPFITLFQVKQKEVQSMLTTLNVLKTTCPKGKELGICFYSFDKTETEIAINGYLEEKEEKQPPPISHQIGASKTGLAIAQPLKVEPSKTKTATKTRTAPIGQIQIGVSNPDWSKMGGKKKTGDAHFVDAGDVLNDYGFYQRGHPAFNNWQEWDYNHPNKQLVSIQDVGNEYYDILLLNVCIGLVLMLTICCIFNMISFLCGAGTGSLLSKKLKLSKLSRKIHQYDRLNNADPYQSAV